MRFTVQTRSLPWLVSRPIAHRGLHNTQKNIFENTPTAFAAAMGQNYSIECDLQSAADGTPMVFHDETLERLTKAKAWVNQTSVSDLQKLKIGSSQDKMQTLPELLEQVGGKVPLIIELKSHWNGDVSLAAQALHYLTGYQGPYALMSFDPDLVSAVAALAPHTIRGITADRVVDAYYNFMPLQKRLALRTLAHLPSSQPHFISYDHLGLPFAPIQAARAAGFPVITWTIRNGSEASRALRYCDQITFEGFLPDG